jgi:uncharacterized delta-60 repeat protein
MRTILAVLALVAAPHAQAQGPSQTWSITLDIPGRGEARALAIADNGDIVVGGYVDRDKESVQASELDGWLARYSADGHLIWEHRIGGEFRDEVATLQIAPDGSIYIAGPRDIQLRQSIKHTASYVARYAAEGVLIWSTQVNDPDGPQVWLTSSRLLDDGSLLVAGGLVHAWARSDAYVALFSAEGEQMWHEWPPEYPEGVDPNAPDKTRFIRTASGDRRVQEHGRLGRLTSDTVELIATQPDMIGPLPARCIVVDMEWGNRADEDCGPMDDFAMHMTPASFPFTASRTGSIANGDGRVRKYNDAGEMVWEYAPATDDGDGFHAAAPAPDGGVVVAGYRLHGNSVDRHNWDGVLIRLDKDGKLVWRREFDAGKRDELTEVALLPDGSIVAAGYTTPADADIWKPWVMRLNSEGQLE